jgi:excisionase family DNA binding protein
MTCEEAAKVLRIGRRAVLAAVARGTLPAAKLSLRWFRNPRAAVAELAGRATERRV